MIESVNNNKNFKRQKNKKGYYLQQIHMQKCH